MLSKELIDAEINEVMSKHVRFGKLKEGIAAVQSVHDDLVKNLAAYQGDDQAVRDKAQMKIDALAEQLAEIAVEVKNHEATVAAFTAVG